MLPLITAVFAFMLGWVAQQFRQMTLEHANNLNDHIKDLDKFCLLAVKYWTSDLNEDGLRAAQAELRAASFPVVYFFGDADMDIVPSMPSDRDAYIDLIDAATGGEFESSERKIDPIRALEVAEITANLIHSARKRRNRLSSFGYFLERSKLRLSYKNKPKPVKVD